MGVKSAGRMINTTIADSRGVAKLSPKALALFCLLIPHFNPHGKMHAGAGTIKELVCPHVDWLTPRTIPRLLTEISRSTSVKYFHDETGRPFLHSLNFTDKHQKLNKTRMGKDHFPDYPGDSPTSHGVVRSEGEGEGEGEEEREEPGKPGITDISQTSHGVVKNKKVEIYETARGRKLTGDKLVWFKKFWQAFAYPHGKAKAADSWLDIKGLDEKLAKEIIAGARREAKRRPELVAKDRTPKWAQGWLTERRWEDVDPAEKRRAETKEKCRQLGVRCKKLSLRYSNVANGGGYSERELFMRSVTLAYENLNERELNNLIQQAEIKT